MIIGIDAGKNTGIAFNEDGKITRLETLDFWGAISIINEYKTALFVVELPKSKHVWHKGATNRGAIAKTGMNVGSVIREAELIIDYLKLHSINYKSVAPLGKKDADFFKRVTGYVGRTNNHERDAALLTLVV